MITQIKPSDVLIVGAGLSGLALATKLINRGIDVRVIEARSRSGGRILSVASTRKSIDAAYLDMGPSWIWPGQPQIESLLKAMHIDVFEQYSSGNLVYENELGLVRRDYDYSTMGGSLRIDGGMQLVINRLKDNLPDSSVLESHRLVNIKTSGDIIIATVETSQRSIEFQTNKIVFCVPPRLVATTIGFEPELPADVIQSLQLIPTWMAGHGKFTVVYDKPFWRDMGLSGDAISRQGPLMEIHDASPMNLTCGALFGFVGLPAHSPEREASSLIENSIKQLERLFGPQAANPVDVFFRDWALEPFTATQEDTLSGHHPDYGLTGNIKAMKARGIYFSSTETSSQSGGFIEGALEAAENTAQLIMTNLN
jgi:monoamine oxidase